MFQKIGCVIIAFALFYSCQGKKQPQTEAEGEKRMEIKVTSPAFGEGEMIPSKYTCDGENVSPPLAWTSIPGGTHRYYFKLYALDTMLDLETGITKEQLLKAMEGHILAQGQLMGKYKRQ